MNSVEVDIAIVGAGVVGLWLLNVFSQQGYQCVLVEKDAIGAGQTIRSQGIIHGGTKYALTGKLNRAAQSIADMPVVWQACLDGKGPVDLRVVQVLSQQHFMWSQGKYTAALKNFIASKALKSHSDVLKPDAHPDFFKHPEFSGSLCALNETVVDVPSLLAALAAPYRDKILLGEAAFIDDTLHLVHAGTLLNIKAQKTLVTAGEGAEQLCSTFTDAPKMQCRPLHMVWARFPEYDPVKQVFVHGVVSGSKPEFTITSHRDAQGHSVWYIGGEVAETGMTRNAKAQIAHTQQVLSQFMPWVNFEGVQWGTDHVNRAELAQSGGKRPDSFAVCPTQRAVVIWPTKLALTPAVAHAVQNLLVGLHASASIVDINWPTVPLAQPLWANKH